MLAIPSDNALNGTEWCEKIAKLGEPSRKKWESSYFKFAISLICNKTSVIVSKITVKKQWILYFQCSHSLGSIPAIGRRTIWIVYTMSCGISPQNWICQLRQVSCTGRRIRGTKTRGTSSNLTYASRIKLLTYDGDIKNLVQEMDLQVLIYGILSRLCRSNPSVSSECVIATANYRYYIQVEVFHESLIIHLLAAAGV